MSFVTRDLLEDSFAKFGDARTAYGRGENRNRRGRLFPHNRLEIGFIRRHNRRPLSHLAQKFTIFGMRWFRCVEHDEYQVGVGQGFHGFADADGFDLKLIHQPPELGSAGSRLILRRMGKDGAVVNEITLRIQGQSGRVSQQR